MFLHHPGIVAYTEYSKLCPYPGACIAAVHVISAYRSMALSQQNAPS